MGARIYAPGAMRPLALMLLSACTEPTWYPGLPSGVSADTASPSDSGGADGGGTEDGGSEDGGGSGDGGGEELPCSQPAGAAATLTIDIQADLGLILYWRDEACDEWSYGVVPPYVPREQGTYVGHAWVLRDAVTGAHHDHRVIDETNELWEVSE